MSDALPGIVFDVAQEFWRGSTQHSSGERFPKSVVISCPKCGVRSTFSLREGKPNRSSMSIASKAVCPSCGNFVHFVAFYPNSTGSSTPQSPLRFLAYSEINKIYISTLVGDRVPDRLAVALKSAIDSYNTQNYHAAMNGGRRALEGLFKLRLPEGERDRKLHEMIRDASQSPSLIEPLTRLANSIKNGGNLGSHFDEDREPTEQMARRTIELLEYLVTYFYILPGKIGELERSIDP